MNSLGRSSCSVVGTVSSQQFATKGSQRLSYSDHYLGLGFLIVTFSTDDFVEQFKRSMKAKSTSEFIMGRDKLQMCLNLFKCHGVYAESDGTSALSAWYKIAGYNSKKLLSFEEI